MKAMLSNSMTRHLIPHSQPWWQKFIVQLMFYFIVIPTAIFNLVSCPEIDRAENDRRKDHATQQNTILSGIKGMKNFDCQNDCIVLIGASYAKGWPLKEINGIPVLNRGVDGEQSFEVLNRFRKDVIAIKLRAVIIWGYINDIHRTDRSKIDMAIGKAKNSFIAMVELSEKNGIIPILATEVTIRHKNGLIDALQNWVGKLLRKKSYQDYVNQHVLNLNRWLKGYAQEKNLLVLDLQPLISDHNNIRLKKYATDDGTHISEQGYKQLTAYATKRLENYLKR
jgi:lysophospholipase L1-like esterase